MHGGTYRHLDRFQIEPACSPEVLKDDPEQPAYFAFDFPANRFSRFFSWVLNVSSRGMARQMASLVSIKVPLNV
jgi:hypothetical protein